MGHVLVRRRSWFEYAALVKAWLESTPDGNLFDPDVMNHESTFLLQAFDRTGPLAFMPVQQPLMLENLIFRPGLNAVETAACIARLAEHALEECYARDAGEAYFLCRDQSTLKFAERHLFRELPDNLKVRRLNLLETFG